MCKEPALWQSKKEKKLSVFIWTIASSYVQINIAPWVGTGLLFLSQISSCLLKSYFAKFERKKKN